MLVKCSTALALLLLLPLAPLSAADPQPPIDVWPGTAARRSRPDRRGDAGQRRGHYAGVQRHAADAHLLSAGQGQRHRRRGDHQSGRRLFDPGLGSGRGRSGPLAQLDRRDRHRAQIPGARPGRKAPLRGSAARRSAGREPGAEQGRRAGHRPEAHRHARLFRRRQPDGHHLHEFRQAGVRPDRRCGQSELPPRFRHPGLSRLAVAGGQARVGGRSAGQREDPADVPGRTPATTRSRRTPAWSCTRRSNGPRCRPSCTSMRRGATASGCGRATNPVRTGRSTAPSGCATRN